MDWIPHEIGMCGCSVGVIQYLGLTLHVHICRVLSQSGEPHEAMLSRPWGSPQFQSFSSRGVAINTTTVSLKSNFQTLGEPCRPDVLALQAGFGPQAGS